MRLRRRRPRLPSIEVLRLEPGDILTVSWDGELTQDQAEHIRRTFAGRIPGHEILVVTTGLKLGVVRPCTDGPLIHDFKGQPICPACGFTGITTPDAPRPGGANPQPPEPRPFGLDSYGPI